MTTLPTMVCAGCGATIATHDPAFPEWWREHGRCLAAKYGDPPSEINQAVREAVRRK